MLFCWASRTLLNVSSQVSFWQAASNKECLLFCLVYQSQCTLTLTNFFQSLSELFKRMWVFKSPSFRALNLLESAVSNHAPGLQWQSHCFVNPHIRLIACSILVDVWTVGKVSLSREWKLVKSQITSFSFQCHISPNQVLLSGLQLHCTPEPTVQIYGSDTQLAQTEPHWLQWSRTGERNPLCASLPAYSCSKTELWWVLIW